MSQVTLAFCGNICQNMHKFCKEYKEKRDMERVITFGEIMLRLAPEGYYRFVQTESYGATYSGGLRLG
jgi:hypothetical protein